MINTIKKIFGLLKTKENEKIEEIIAPVLETVEIVEKVITKKDKKPKTKKPSAVVENTPDPQVKPKRKYNKTKKEVK